MKIFVFLCLFLGYPTWATADVVESIINNEGFRAQPYRHNGKIYFGHGLSFITERESVVIVSHRVETVRAELSGFIEDLTPARQEVLIEMAYQIGVPGLLKFTEMWRAIQAGQWRRAAFEMLNSKWARMDSPKRADKLALKFLKG